MIKIYFLCDILGKQPKLYINNVKRHKTLCGAFTSIFLFLSIVSMILFFFLDFILGSGMTVIYSKEFLTNPISYQLNQQIFMIQFADLSGNLVDPRIAKLFAVYLESEKRNSITQNIQLEQCAFDKHFPKSNNSKLLNNINITKFNCFDPQFNITLFYNQQNIHLSNVIIYIQKCINNTKNNNTCFSDEEITKALNNNSYYISLLFEDTLIDHFNFSHNPIQKKIEIINKPLSFSLNSDYYLYWKKIIYRSDRGFYYNAWKTYTDYQFDYSLQETVVHSNTDNYNYRGIYSKIQIALHNSSYELYRRQFPKIQIVIANSSGIINVLIHACGFIVKVFTDGHYYSTLMNTIKTDKMSKLNFNIKSGKSRTYPNRKHILDIPGLEKKCLTKVSLWTSLQWAIIPKLNSQTYYLTKCREFICSTLNIETIINNFFAVDFLLKKENGSLNNGNYSLSDLISKQPMRNNYFKSNNSLILTKHDIPVINSNLFCKFEETSNKI